MECEENQNEMEMACGADWPMKWNDLKWKWECNESCMKWNEMAWHENEMEMIMEWAENGMEWKYKRKGQAVNMNKEHWKWNGNWDNRKTNDMKRTETWQWNWHAKTDIY